MVRGISGIIVPSLYYNYSQNGKMSFPVDPPYLMYSHFEHVSGVPAMNGLQGVSISKLNLLDVLITRLNQIRNTQSSGIRADQSEGIDSVIESYRSQIKQAHAASQAMPYNPSPNANAGALFNLFS